MSMQHSYFFLSLNMSVPHTSTHALSLFNHQNSLDSIAKRPVAELSHPVQRIDFRDGSADPQNYRYDGFYELEDVIEMTRNPMYPADLNDYDDVKWTDLDAFNHQSGVQPSNYSSETPYMLQTARALQRGAKNREEENQRYRRSMAVRQAALRMDPLTIAALNAAATGGAWQPQPTGYYAVDNVYDGDTHADPLRPMGLGKRSEGRGASEGGGGKRRFASMMQ